MTNLQCNRKKVTLICLYFYAILSFDVVFGILHPSPIMITPHASVFESLGQISKGYGFNSYHNIDTIP